MSLNVLFLGDVVGKPGRRVIKDELPKFREEKNIDFVVCNAENAAGGFGLDHKSTRELFEAGVDVITLGDHTWDKHEINSVFEQYSKVLRPLNFPKSAPGKGFAIYTTAEGKRIAVLNIIGRSFMNGAYDCPFQVSRALHKEYRLGEDYDALVIDIHAEATAEAVCLGHIWDGRASLISGSHTHIPTADYRIMPKGTGYQTDAGMCGFYDSSLGSEFKAPLHRFENAGKAMLQIASGPGTMCGVMAKVADNGLCEEITPVRVGGVLHQAR